MPSNVTACSICHKPAMDSNGPVGDVVDCFKYDFDGSLDYIMLMHRKCALGKGYKIKGDRVVTEVKFMADKDKTKENAPCTSCGGTGIYALKSHGGQEHQCPSCKGTGIHPYPFAVREDIKRVPFKYSVERVKGTLDYRIVDTLTRKPVGGTYKVRDYDDDDIGSLKAANSRCAQMNRDWADKQDPPVQMRESLPEPHEEEVRRIGGRFQVVNHKGKPVGKSHPSYSAAQKADHAARKNNWQESAPLRYQVRRIPNTPNFVVVDTGHGKTYDTYLDRDHPKEGPQMAAQRDADDLNRIIGPVHRIGETSDAAPAIAKNECSTKRFGAWQKDNK